jgi:quinol monooxygenase YgiN
MTRMIVSPTTITLTAEFTMRIGKVREALALVTAVKQQAEKTQPGTLVYLVHRVLENGRPGRTLVFYERYRDQRALDAHLNSSSWKAVEKGWTKCFEGPSSRSIQASTLMRVAAFERAGAIPLAP